MQIYALVIDVFMMLSILELTILVLEYCIYKGKRLVLCWIVVSWMNWKLAATARLDDSEAPTCLVVLGRLATRPTG